MYLYTIVSMFLFIYLYLLNFAGNTLMCAQQQKRYQNLTLKKNTNCFFITGPVLPYSLCLSAMAESPDGRGVLLFGGMSDGHELKDRILELRAGANSWNISDITLKNSRRSHAVILL